MTSTARAGPTPDDASDRTPARDLRKSPGILTRRPEIVPAAVAALAWVTLTAGSPLSSWTILDGGSLAGATAGPPLGTHAGHGGIFTLAGLSMVTLMTVAMMAPLAIPSVRTVAFAGAGWRAGRAGSWFLAASFTTAFIATWSVLAVCLTPVAEMLAGILGSATLAAGLVTVACALAQFDPRRTQLIRVCDRPMQLRSGPEGNVDCARFGVSTAGRGLRLCALPMLAMLTIPSSLLVMALLTTLSVADRVTRGSRRLPIAASYLLLAGVLLTSA